MAPRLVPPLHEVGAGALLLATSCLFELELREYYGVEGLAHPATFNTDTPEEVGMPIALLRKCRFGGSAFAEPILVRLDNRLCTGRTPSLSLTE